MAVICRHTVWTRPPEPDDLENEGLWCSRSEAATECEVLQASKPQSAMGSSHGSDSARGTRPARPCGFAAALGRRCRVAHNSTGPTSVSIAYETEEELRLGRRTSEATSARVVRQCSTSGEHSRCGNTASYPHRRSHHNGGALTVSPSCEVCGTKMRPNGELPSDPQRDRQAPSDAEAMQKAPLAVHRRSACSGVKALRNTSDARRQAAKLC